MKNLVKEKQLNEVLYGLDYIGNKARNEDAILELGKNNCKLLLEEIEILQDMDKILRNENINLKLRINKAIENIENIKPLNEEETKTKEKLKKKYLKTICHLEDFEIAIWNIKEILGSEKE